MIINLHQHELQAVDRQDNIHTRFISLLLDVTRHSTHSYERTVHRLLLDLSDCHRDGQLHDHEYATIIGGAMDVAYYFNYDPALLLHEQNTWYRASIIHQMGQGMLQVVSQLRPDMMCDAMFHDAANELSITRPKVNGLPAKGAMPITCRQFGKGDIATEKLLRFPF